MGRFLSVFQPELSPKAPETPPSVSALRRTLPSDRPQAPGGRSPTAAQGGFIENLEENARYQDILDNDRRRGATRTKRSIHVVAREAIMEAQNDGETKDEAQVHTGKKDVPEDEAAMTKGRRKRDVFGTAMKAILCTASKLPETPASRTYLSKARPDHAADEELLLGKGEDEHSCMASRNVQAE
ncbi:hypothetical protein N0V86_009000 [Didymella sp. IMI 355093]|nr:hypothetical protein N0V86_009000 [Didymella sp. IMI 355093]